MNLDILFEDKRPIDEMTFGLEAPEDERAAVADGVRQLLQECGCKTAEDIVKLGCTGVAEHWMRELAASDVSETAADVAISAGQRLRLGLAGGGVGLPCFVAPDRYCLIHETIGGLQDGQLQRHAEFAEAISRELTPVERNRMKLTEVARRRHAGSLSDTTTAAANALGGRDLKALEDAFGGDVPATAPADTLVPAAAPWVCDQHKQPQWRCRHCVAQMIVEGTAEPTFALVNNDDGTFMYEALDAGLLETEMQRLNDANCSSLSIYAQAAYLSRKLSR